MIPEFCVNFADSCFTFIIAFELNFYLSSALMPLIKRPHQLTRCLLASPAYDISLSFHSLTGLDKFLSFSLTSQRMKSTTAIARSNPTISYYRFTKVEGIAIYRAFIVACFFIVAGNFLTIVLFA